ncbi:MAG: AmmeMemoRadiSam system radical SAM enzyme, partial [Bacteroidota bacterium]
MATLGEFLSEHTAEGALYVALAEGAVRCTACGHRCRIPPGREGVCRVRFNRGGKLYVPRGYTAGLALDPIEKKPFFHVLPGCRTLSFGMLGCDYHCPWCQNWLTSQVLRDPRAGARPVPVEPEDIVEAALREGAPVITSTYNEPLITSEWAMEVFRLARPHGIRCAYVSNGNASPEVLDYLRHHVDFFKVDLKSFRAETYRRMGGTLKTVLASIRRLAGEGVWTEVVTLVVPGVNDSERELAAMGGFLASVSPDIPWHLTAFHGDYRMRDAPHTPAELLRRAAGIGREAGLRFVYTGNVSGADGGQNTLCPGCGRLLVERSG